MAKNRANVVKSTAMEETRDLRELVEHPLQQQFNEDLSDPELQALAVSIKKRGLREKIHVMPGNNKAKLPANCVLDGHQRLRALLLLGWTVATVIVHYDLQDATADAVEEEYLAFNADRGHKDMLARARIALRRLEIEKNRPRGGLGMYEQAEARDRIAKLFKLGSGRTASRYWRVLKTPQEVQDAFRTGALSLIVAEKVADLRPEIQKEVAQRISKGEKPKDVVDFYVATKSSERHIKVGHAVGSLARALDKAFADIADRLDQVRRSHVSENETTLRKGKKLIYKLLKSLEAPASTEEKATADFRKQIGK